jgi:hypothetical protein
MFFERFLLIWRKFAEEVSLDHHLFYGFVVVHFSARHS